MPSESWLLLWQTVPLTAFVLIQPGCHKAHCGSSTQCSDCWAGAEQLCQRGTFCFTVMSISVPLVPYREMLLCFCSFLLYTGMKREGLVPLGNCPWHSASQYLSVHVIISVFHLLCWTHFPVHPGIMPVFP